MTLRVIFTLALREVNVEIKEIVRKRREEFEREFVRAIVRVWAL